jgi:Tfp pilus assembly protein PilX
MTALRRGHRRRAKVRGVALVVALLLLGILGMLAGAGVRMSIGEMWMAGNEQFHGRAMDAASAGVEVAIARVGATGGSSAVGTWTQPFGAASEFTASVRRTGQESVLVGSSAGRVTGEHFEIETTGTSSRGARDVQVQGVMVVSSTAGVAQFARAGAGLSDGAAP